MTGKLRELLIIACKGEIRCFDNIQNNYISFVVFVWYIQHSYKLVTFHFECKEIFLYFIKCNYEWRIYHFPGIFAFHCNPLYSSKTKNFNLKLERGKYFLVTIFASFEACLRMRQNIFLHRNFLPILFSSWKCLISHIYLQRKTKIIRTSVDFERKSRKCLFSFFNLIIIILFGILFSFILWRWDWWQFLGQFMLSDGC